MRVLLVNDVALDRGWGTERHVSQLARALAAAGHTVDVFAGEVHHDGWRKAFDAWDPMARRALARRIKEFRPDVVHFHNVLRELSPSVFGVAGAAGAVLTVHDFRIVGHRDPSAGFGPRGLARSWADRIARVVARARIDVAIAVSRSLTDELERADFPAVEYVPCFVDDPPEELLPVAACHDVVFAGQLTADKGPQVILAAFAKVVERHPRARLTIAGDGPDAAALRAQAGAVARVEFTGRLTPDAVEALLARARVVAIPSIPTARREGVPLILLEAAAAGRAILASDDPGIAEAMHELGAGAVLPAGAVDSWAAALDEMLRDDERATACGAHGRERVMETRSERVVLPQIEQVYERARLAARDR